MSRALIIALYVVVMVGLIVAIDLLFLRDHFWWRLAANVGIVAVFALVYVLVMRGTSK